jgi:hypothetical protein
VRAWRIEKEGGGVHEAAADGLDIVDARAVTVTFTEEAYRVLQVKPNEYEVFRSRDNKRVGRFFTNAPGIFVVAEDADQETIKGIAALHQAAAV